jgi:tRNA A58 N-methylase Trm61
MFRLFVEHCHIQPHYAVLDVGSGIGRMARPLTRFLNGAGAYYGFDIVKPGIQWCKKSMQNFQIFTFSMWRCAMTFITSAPLFVPRILLFPTRGITSIL